MASHVIHLKCFSELSCTIKTRGVAIIEIPVIQCTSLQDFLFNTYTYIYHCYKQFKSM